MSHDISLFNTPFSALSCAAALGVMVPILAFPAAAAHAQRFDPVKTTPSLGAFPKASGTYTIDTTGALPNPNGQIPIPPKGSPDGGLLPVIKGPNGYVKVGVFKQGCAVFAWDSITVGSKQHLIGAGSRPLVLLSKSTVLIQKGGTITVSGAGGTSATQTSENAPFSSFGGRGGGGGGAGGNGSINPSPSGSGTTAATAGKGVGGAGIGGYVSGGGGFGGAGGSGVYVGQSGYETGGTGGIAYGDPLSNTLQGGSGGGGTTFAGGGGGGGALEISAAASITINGTGTSDYATLSASGGSGNRGNGGANTYTATGGGSGGMIYLCAPKITLSGSDLDIVRAVGGNAGLAYSPVGPYRGGPGGGGRIRIEQSALINTKNFTQ